MNMSIYPNTNTNTNVYVSNSNVNNNVNINNNIKMIDFISVMRFGVNTSTTNKYQNKIMVLLGVKNYQNIAIGNY